MRFRSFFPAVSPFNFAFPLKPYAPLALSIAITLSSAGFLTASAQYNVGDYGYYFEQGSSLYSHGEISKAIDMFKKAAPLAGDDSIPSIYNNLGAAYIRRGLYFQNSLKNYNSAINDYRNALFYLDTAWPENISKRPIHERNYGVTLQNLNSAYAALSLNPADKNMHLAQARQLRAKGNLQEAIVEYAQALKLDPKNGEAAKSLGELFNVVNMPAKAQKYYQEAGNVLGDKAGDDLFMQQAAVAFKAGDIDKSVQLYNKALEINPQNTAALDQLEKIWLNEIKFNNASVLGHANLASVLQKKKMYEEALQQYNAAEHFAEMNRATPFDVKKLIRLNLGTLYQEKKQYQLAQAAYDTILQTEPNNILALTYKASLMKEVGRAQDAENIYRKIASIDPNNTLARDALFSLAADEKDPEQAAKALKAYADSYQNNADIQTQVGEEFHRRKDYANAEAYYERAVTLNPNLAGVYANLGAIYQVQGKNQEGIAAYKKAAQLDPGNKTVKDLLSQAENNQGVENFSKAAQLQQEGKHSEALPYFQKALAQTPNNAELAAAYGVSLQNLNRQDEAIHQYQKAISLAPQNADFQYYLGTAYHQKNQLPLAAQAYKKAIQLNPNNTDAKSALASIDQQQSGASLQQAIDAYNGKRYPQALTSVNEALAKNKQDAVAHYYKGLILQAQKSPAAAKASYREATVIKPDFADAYYALAVITDEMKDYASAKSAYKKFIELSGNSEDEFVKYAKDRVTALSTQ